MQVQSGTVGKYSRVQLLRVNVLFDINYPMIVLFCVMECMESSQQGQHSDTDLGLVARISRGYLAQQVDSACFLGLKLPNRSGKKQVLSNNGNTGWFRLKGTLEIIQFQHLYHRHGKEHTALSVWQLCPFTYLEKLRYISLYLVTLKMLD